MPNLHRILRSTLLAATLITGVGALAAAQAPAQAARIAPGPRGHRPAPHFTSTSPSRHELIPRPRMR